MEKQSSDYEIILYYARKEIGPEKWLKVLEKVTDDPDNIRSSLARKGVQQSAFNRQVGGSYYKQYKIEPYKFFFENNITHEKAAIIRRILRYDAPDGNGLQDLEKIKHECDLIAELKGYKQGKDVSVSDLLDYIAILLHVASSQVTEKAWANIQKEAIERYEHGNFIAFHFEKPEELK